MDSNAQHPALTLFAIPKPFRGHFDIIQHNALQSWLRLSPDYEIILLGSEEGTAEVAAELGLGYVAGIVTNDHGTPLVSDLFEQAQRAARSDILAYVNSDIILMSDFVSAVAEVTRSMDRFLMVGQRWGINIRELWDFGTPNWESKLQEEVHRYGTLGAKAAIDYFVFFRGLFDPIPPFAIGRMGWDNWLISRARKQSASVIDATARVMAVHQNHDYLGFSSKVALRSGEEALLNTKLLGGGYGDLHDVTHLLLPEVLRSAWSLGELVRQPRRLASRFPVLRALMRPKRTLILFWPAIRSALGFDRISQSAPRSHDS